LRLALTSGSALEPAFDLLAAAGLPVEPLRAASRRPVTVLADGTSVVLLRPADVPAYVEAGAADVGIAGKDWLLEQGRDLYELLDLRSLPGRLVFAQPGGATEGRRRRLGRLRVATRYEKVTRDYFGRSGRQVEVIPLQDDVELAPRLGLADGIVILVDSDSTLDDADLRERAEIARSTLRLVASRAAHTLLSAEIEGLTERLRPAGLTEE
jgi:ATP phosphoribosyltransferase